MQQQHTSDLVRSYNMKIETFTNTLLTGEMREDMIIYDDNGGYVSMPKAVYEAQQAEQSTPIVRDDE
jgi:hypothetical protein